MKRDTLCTMLAISVLLLTLIPVGIAVFVLGFWFGDSPCVMCWEQRIGMSLIALIGLLILRYGPQPRYVGLAILTGAWGLYMGIRHTALHAARDIGQGFSVEILGAHTYTWSAFIFWVCVMAIGLLLMALKGEAVSGARELRPLDRAAAVVFLLVTAGNAAQAFASTGPPPFMGQSDPVRFSFNPKHWVWSVEEWVPTPVSLRGRWSVEKPSLEGLVTDPGRGPLTNLRPLSMKRRIQLGVPLQGTPTDLAYEAAGDQFAITTQHGIYVTNGVLDRILRHTIVDPGFSVDLGLFAGVAFLDTHTIMALSQNKSYVILREDDHADAGKNYRFLLESFNMFTELSRSRFSTVRSRMMYVMSLAHDPASDSLFTITVPNAKTRQLVIARFDRKDLVLSEEFVPRIGPESGLALRDGGHSLAEYYLTGATIVDGRLFAVSPAYSTLLCVDLAGRSVVAAYALDGIGGATGIAVRHGEVFIAGEGNSVCVFDRPD